MVFSTIQKYLFCWLLWYQNSMWQHEINPIFWTIGCFSFGTFTTIFNAFKWPTWGQWEAFLNAIYVTLLLTLSIWKHCFMTFLYNLWDQWSKQLINHPNPNNKIAVEKERLMKEICSKGPISFLGIHERRILIVSDATSLFFTCTWSK